MKFIGNDKCPLNSLDLIPLDYHVWTAMLKMYQMNLNNLDYAIHEI